jgi:glycosyltransferase involved in cell wall biosynthesis
MASECPRVSIVIPAYNQGEYLAQAIDSVLAQDYPQVELIVLDDGSSDNTRALIASYGEKIVAGSHANCGQAATLNKGWAKAQGDILGYLSADDFLLPGAVTRSVTMLGANSAAVVCYCDFRLVDSAAKLVRHVRAPDYSYPQMVLRMVCAPGPGAFFLRHAFERAGPWDETLRQVPDFEFWLRLGAVGPFVRIAEELAAYRVHDGSQSFAPCSEARAEEPYNVMVKYFCDSQASSGNRESRAEALANAHLLTARLHLRSGRVARAYCHLRDALGTWPLIAVQLRTWRLLANAIFNRIAHRAVWWLNRLRGAGTA